MLKNNKLNSFSYFKVDCYYKSVLAILSHYNITLLPIAIFKHGFFSFVNDKISFDNVDIYDFDKILKDMNIKRALINVDRDNFVSTICENMLFNTNKSIVLWIDLYYDNLFPSVYMKKHARHCVPVFGFSKEKQEFHIIDSDYIENFLPIETSLSFRVAQMCFFSYVDFFKSQEYIHVFEYCKESNKKKLSNYELNRKYINVYHDFIMRNYDLFRSYLMKIRCFFEDTQLEQWILDSGYEEGLKKSDCFYIAFNNAVSNRQNLYAILSRYMNISNSVYKVLERLIDSLN